MSTETATRKGRRLDGTPNKVISENLVKKHEDGTGDYEKIYNDENGKRQSKTERMSLKRRGGGGRSLDMTPNREFTARIKSKNSDGTATYVIPYNDENGVRHENEETRTLKLRGGHRQPNSTPSKVISSIKSERIATDQGESGNNIVMTIPYNDKDGIRKESFVTLTVNSKGNLTTKVEQDKPLVYVRQRKTVEREDSTE